jgi:hypothetical protein
MASGQPADNNATTQTSFTATVRADGTGWVAEVELGDGASMTKWFSEKRAAERYPRELADWLTQRRDG